jgi:hypothetical protein
MIDLLALKMEKKKTKKNLEGSKMNFIFKDNSVILLSEKNDLFAPICLLMTNESW